MLHRTQILIEQWQYEALRARAEREQRSLSALVRDLLDEALRQDGGPSPAGHPLRQIEGIGEAAGSYGRDHDALLYGDDQPD